MTTAPVYSRSDVVLVDFPFSGSVGSKRRPAVVMSTDGFNQAGIKVIIAGITSNLLPPFRPGDTMLNDWGAAGLLKPSAVRGIVATQDRSEIVRTLGRLSAADFANVESAIAGIMGF